MRIQLLLLQIKVIIMKHHDHKHVTYENRISPAILIVFPYI